MQTISALIAIHSSAHRGDDLDDETITMLTSGTLELEEGRAVIRYQESLDESLPPQDVTLTIADGCATMERGGDYTASMVFRKDCRYEGMYRTPFGEMELAVFCTRLRCQLDATGGTVSLGYQLDLNGQFAAVHDMELTVIPQESEDEA